MCSYVIYTDSACDVRPELLHEWGVYSSNLTFHFEGEETEYSSEGMPASQFFGRMRDGGIARTSAVNVGTFLEEFEKLLQQGLDILYIGFASTLSATFNSAAMAVEQLRSHYPQRKIITIDTLCVSSGQALVVYETVQKKNSGATIEEAAAFAEDVKNHVCQWITVEDLVYLKRGGRISPTTALVGKALGIKPLIFINKEGKLESVDKARGKKKALLALADKYGQQVREPGSSVFITHGDCIGDAKFLAQVMAEKYGAKAEVIAALGAVVGAHIGPGGIVFSFLGKTR